MKTAAYSVLCGCALFCSSAAAQRITFDAIPSGWDVQGKPFTKAAVFKIETDPAMPEHRWLSMSADNATASLVSGTLNVDLKKTPIMRWRWRVTVLPTGADGRDPAKDDQAIGLYISSGGRFKQQSIAYRWETQPPAGADGSAKYAKGIVSIRWFALRDQSHTDGQTFFVEERNLAEDFQKAFGAVPERIGLGISCNSQYTGSSAEAQLDWVEFVAPAP
jgi:hypothetical protein